MGTWVVSFILDILITWLRGDLLDPPLYLPAVLHLMVLGAVGVFITNRRFDLGLGIYALVFALAWSLGIRRTLGL